MKITMEQIKTLRERTGAGVMEAKKALEEVISSSKSKTQNLKQILEEAEKIIRKKGLVRAEKKAERETGQGVVHAYVHHNGKSGAMITLLCETDFVAKTDDFRWLANEIAMQVTGMKAKDKQTLLKQEYVRDPKMTIEELIKQTAAKVGENIRLGEMWRVEL